MLTATSKVDEAISKAMQRSADDTRTALDNTYQIETARRAMELLYHYPWENHAQKERFLAELIYVWQSYEKRVETSF